MNTDSYFTIGGPHLSACEPCQDYALSGVFDNGVAYALVSDGSSCAGSENSEKGRTDIGSRLVAHAFVFAIKGFGPDEIVNALASGEVFKVFLERLTATRYTESENDLLATLVAVVSNGVSAVTLCLGDGVIAKTRTDGQIDITELSWNANTPYYPAYAILGRLESFIQHHRLMLGAEVGEAALSFTIEKTTISSDGLVTLVSEKHPAGDFASRGYMSICALENVKSITVFSDGISQMPGGLPLGELVKKFTSFKSTKGRFISRRAHSALTKDFKESPKDDFSAAGIWNGD